MPIIRRSAVFLGTVSCVALLVPLGAGAAGSPPAPRTAPAPSESTTAVNTIWGPVEVPRDPEVIVAVDEYAALGLLTVGHQPSLVLGPYSATVATALLAEADVEVTPAVYGDWNYELIAATEPDLIVLVGGAETEELFDTLSDIAPTVVLSYVAPWREIAAAYGDLGDALNGTDGTGERIVGAIETRIDDVTDDVAGQSISVLAGGGAFGTYTLGADASTSLLLTELGMTRPAAQQLPSTLGVMLPLSDEQLADHGAEVLAMLGGDDNFFPADGLQEIPTFELAASGSDTTVEVMGELWTSSDPFAMWWVVDDVAAIDAGTAPGTIDDAEPRFTAYLAALDA